jgi:hypothetical protein
LLPSANHSPLLVHVSPPGEISGEVPFNGLELNPLKLSEYITTAALSEATLADNSIAVAVSVRCSVLIFFVIFMILSEVYSDCIF